ncbi:hypothetical protein SLOPH_911, partial [Spraguea lophii 42_110]
MSYKYTHYLNDFEFKRDYKLSEEIILEYKRIKSNIKNIEYMIINYDNSKKRYKNAYKIIESLYNCVDKIDKYMTTLIDELFNYNGKLKTDKNRIKHKKSKINEYNEESNKSNINVFENLHRKKHLFIILNKLFKLIYILDNFKTINIKILTNFSVYKNKLIDKIIIKKYNINKISKKDGSQYCSEINKIYRDYFNSNDYLYSYIHKLTIFASTALPMAYLFISYFYIDNIIDNSSYCSYNSIKERNRIYIDE